MVRLVTRAVFCNGLVLLTLMLAAHAAHAQGSPLIPDDTGGTTPQAVYCPSTGGGCFTSREAAVAAMRAATPNVGHLLVPESKQYSSTTYIFYHVPDQAPASYGASLYGIDYGGVIGGNNYCPQSLATQDRPTEWGGSYCYDETEMINGFSARPKGCGWHSCTYHDYTVIGDYSVPYTSVSASRYIRWITSDTYINVNSENEGWLQHSINDKYISYLETDHTDGVTRVRSARMVKIQRFACPVGMKPFSTTDVSINPKLCRNTVRPYVQIKVLRQKDSCPVNSYPCHPSSGDKSRAETDFTFSGRSFTRYYHSLRELGPKNFQMGEGWTHSFGTWIFPPGGNASGLYTGSGYRMPIVYISSGKFYVPSLNNATLEQLGDGSWVLTESSGDVSTFSSQGLLSSIRNNRSPESDISLIYDTKSRLSSVIDSTGRTLTFMYDVANTLTKATLPDGNSVTYGYDIQKNLTSVDYGDGRVKQYSYGEVGLATNGDAGLLTGITGENGQRYASFGYDIHGRVLLSTLFGAGSQPVETTRIYYNAANQAQVTTDGGAERIYTYNADSYRRPLAITDASGTTTNTYDSNGRVLTTTDARGAQTRYTYATSKLTSTTKGYGTAVQRTEQTDWHATFNQPIERRTLDAANALIAKANWTYNARGQILTATQTGPVSGISRTVTKTYCEQADVDTGSCPRVGLITSVDGPRTDVSDVASYQHYPADHPDCTAAPTTCAWRKGDLWKVTNALGQVTETLRYDGAGRVLSVKDANGIVTDMEHHPRGWLTARKVRGPDAASEADDQITRIDYWPTGLVSSVTLPDGSFTSYVYDAAHRLTDIVDADGNQLHYTLDNAGNRVKEEVLDEGGSLMRTLSRVYNQLGQLQAQKDASNHATDFTYDANGNTDTVIDALGRVTDNDYDPLNRLVRTLQDVGGIAAETNFQYDALDNLTKVTDPKGLDTTYTYNGLSDLTQLSSPDTGVTNYTYDSAGNRASQTDARGVTATYSYDALNRLSGVSYAGDTALNVTYQYDTVAPTCEPGETFAVGRLSVMTDGSGSTQYCYDRFGNTTRKVQTTNGLTFAVRYAYTKAGQLSAITYPDGTVVDYIRDGQGRIAEVGVTQPGGPRQVLLNQVGYLPFGPSTGWVYGNGRNLTRAYNQDYQPTALHDVATGGLDVGFKFDEVGNLSELTPATNPSPLARFDYDGLNRLTAFRDGATSVAIESYGYDATGNRTSFTNAGGAQAYVYPTNSHRLLEVNGMARSYDAVGNATAIGAKSYAYSAANRLASVSNAGALVRQYAYNGKGEQVRRQTDTISSYAVYDEAGHWLGEYDTNGNAVQQAIWMDDMPVGVVADGQLHYIEPDHLGTPRAVIDPVRNVAVWAWDLKSEAFGNSPPNMDPDGDSQLFVFDLRFPGQRYDSAAGLNYNYFRDYDPSSGRYVQSDPLGLFGDIATYSYASNKPLMHYDFNGLEPIYIGCAGGSGLLVCDGKGGFEARNCNSSCTGECTQIHEDQHKADFIRRAPGRCKGKPRGASPTLESDMQAPFQYYEFECRAYKLTLDCLNGMKGRMCPTPDCQRQVDADTQTSENMMRKYRCKAYGW